MDRQSLDNLRGEIEFRRKLAKQHTDGEIALPNYFTKDEHDRILAERIETTGRQFEEHQRAGMDFSRFVELGAERGHRSLVLANKFDANGIAMDLSLEQLQTMPHFAGQFGFARLPLRVCCDMNALPLRSGVIPFVFCYQFLHHFPGLHSTLPHIWRVMSDGGTFFFDEEPVGRLARFSLYHQGPRRYEADTHKLRKLLHYLEGFISEPWCDETDHGIIENHDMTLSEWVKGFEGKGELRFNIRSLGCLKSDTGHKLSMKNWINLVLGGVISGTWIKGAGDPETGTPSDFLICPDCLTSCQAESALSKAGDFLVCQACGAKYPIVEDVPVLLPSTLRAELYPAFA